MISKQRPQGKVSKEIEDIYSILNQLIDAVNNFSYMRPSDTQGKPGDTRVTEDGLYVRTEKGWEEK